MTVFLFMMVEVHNSYEQRFKRKSRIEFYEIRIIIFYQWQKLILNYIGGTCRYIKDGINYHSRDCKKVDKKTAPVFNSHKSDHLFNFNSTSILCNELNYKRRRFGEMFYIKNPLIQ